MIWGMIWAIVNYLYGGHLNSVPCSHWSAKIDACSWYSSFIVRFTRFVFHCTKPYKVIENMLKGQDLSILFTFNSDCPLNTISIMSIWFRIWTSFARMGRKTDLLLKRVFLRMYASLCLSKYWILFSLKSWYISLKPRSDQISSIRSFGTVVFFCCDVLDFSIRWIFAFKMKI